jgi:hypothetical protein
MVEPQAEHEHEEGGAEYCPSEVGADYFAGPEDGPPPVPRWPAYVALGIGALVAAAIGVGVLANVDGDTRRTLTLTAIRMGARALPKVSERDLSLTGVKRQGAIPPRKKNLLIAVGKGSLVLLLVLVVLGSKGRWTYRSSNSCDYCGYTWHLRGREYSHRCPNCGCRR